MSCYVVSDLTISAIVAAMADTDFEPASLKDEKSGVKYNPATCGQIVGQMLLDANYVSVNEYYGKHTRAHESSSRRSRTGSPSPSARSTAASSAMSIRPASSWIR